ncbi:hypothetical protein CMI37_08490 [Candidatus Pacearchaeota archaeon]|nr:hypothetical protein [Candidatus Pacearchaeota archaeon]|tara:strand:+ start:9106 stop:9489 length:384 start_codon:yes stop_codon:yes gene_type:complete
MFGIKVIAAHVVKDLKDKPVSKSITDGLQKLVLKVEALAKKSTVVDTGRLRSSITHSFGKNEARVGTNVEYAIYVEYGTQKMEARHMEGGSKVLGQGMMAYTITQMDKDLQDFEVQIIKDVKGKIEG